jgi:hypothetical protein
LHKVDLVNENMIESREEIPENEIQNDFLSYNSRKL